MKRAGLGTITLALIAAGGCGNAPAVPDVRFLAAEEACLAQLVAQAAATDTGSFPAYAVARWRVYAALDSSLNHAAAPADSARYVHRSALYQRAAHARDRQARADLGSDYAERLAEVAAANTAECRREARKGAR